ncbi:MAG: phosphotransferase [Anaerolineae bacterium]|nr:phosphotransferase [Anaerolineae bacterium]
MLNRHQHRQEVLTFLQNRVSAHHWELTLPSSGRGHETYIAQANADTYFIKLGAQVSYYQVLASLDLSPAVLMTNYLADGVSILVQPFIKGKHPSWRDFHQYLEKIAAIINKVHHNPTIKKVLPVVPSEQYKDVGMAKLTCLRQKWVQYRSQMPEVADYVDATLAQLEQEVARFEGGGLIASHNDICNANWLISNEGKIYLVDLEAMARDDPAHDMGSLLWWYYPPELRQKFLQIAGYQYDEAFKKRMQVRMAMHCLDITLPRIQSFDSFEANKFLAWLTDYRAVIEGRENPRGYDD